VQVLVTGATGRLGRVLVPRLIQAGHDVRATSRRAHPGQDGVEWIVSDLASGSGLAEAVAGVDAVAHLASAPYKGRYTVQVDVDGTRRLATAARDAGVDHLLYASIVGIDQVPWPYFRRKLAAEGLVKASRTGWSIVRATQFHEFIDAALTIAAKLPVMVIDPGVSAQPVDVRDVADRFVVGIADGPSNRVKEFGGPEILTGSEPLDEWLKARGIRKRMLSVRLPGKLGRAFRSGYLVTNAQPTGRITWREYLQEAYGEYSSRRL
jgi:uncharacterized protein YbjT (DUF2867 family)